jgi:hypothetical protein
LRADLLAELVEKRLLERRRPEAALAPDADRSPAPSLAQEAALPTTSAGPPPLPPLPLMPLHSVRNAGGGVTLRPAVLPAPPRRAPAERRRFDMRGFLAGFALSWAFGVVLYLFLAAG